MEITAARPRILVSFEVSLPHDLFACLALSEMAPLVDGMSDWLRSLPAVPERRAFVSLIRYCPGLWARLTRFAPEHPARTDFDQFMAALNARPEDDYVRLAQVSLRERLAAWGEGAAAPLPEQFRAAQAARHARFGEPSSPDLDPESLAALVGPSLKSFLLDLVARFWREHYAERWELDRPRMEAAARFHSRQQYSPNFASLFVAATGRAMPDSIRDSLNGVTQAVFVPSCHVGPYFIFTVSLPLMAISFNALTVDAAAHSRPEIVSLFPPLKALADETRLQILSLLADGRERYAQEIMTELALSQSAASRHLTLLEKSGLLSVRKDGASKFYSLNAAGSHKLIDSLRKLLTA